MVTPTNDAVLRHVVCRCLVILISALLLLVAARGAELRETRAGSNGQQLSDPRQHWAFQAVKKPALPKVKNQVWVKSPVDAFILAKLEERGWQSAPPTGQ